MSRKSSFGTLSKENMLGGGVIFVLVLVVIMIYSKSEFGTGGVCATGTLCKVVSSSCVIQ